MRLPAFLLATVLGGAATATGGAPAGFLRVGFGSRSPIGPGVRAVFSGSRYETRRIRDVFAGR